MSRPALPLADRGVAGAANAQRFVFSATTLVTNGPPDMHKYMLVQPTSCILLRQPQRAAFFQASETA